MKRCFCSRRAAFGQRCLGPLRAVLAAATLALLAGCAALPPPRAAFNLLTPAPNLAADRPAFNARVYDQVWDWVNRRYYDPRFNGADWAGAKGRHRAAALAARDDTELYAAINALLTELGDAHAHALSPSEVEEFVRRRGVFIGVRTGPVAGFPERRRVVEVFPDGPAAAAGVKAGWILLAVDGRRPDEVLGAGRLRDGQVVHCDFVDGEERPHGLDLRARRQGIPVVREARRLAGGALALRFDSYDLPAARWVRSQLDGRASASGVVFDLRRNGGGETRALTAILADIFAETVDIGSTVERGGNPGRHHSRPTWFGSPYRGPVAVLVSGETASAAEIMAYVVQHYHRGVIIGERTAGMVLVGVRWPLAGGGELQLSVYDYRAPGGARLEGRGVTPDIVVAPAIPPAFSGADPAIAAAERALADREHETNRPVN